MSKIHLLSDELVGKISAGEVIERPLSVVKELVENSIDAGSDEITLKIDEDCEREITVIDNGCGLNQEDVRLAFLCHATSKIENEFDLNNINTLGFRGEALFSIATVSRIIIKTKRKDQESGYTAKIEGAKIIEDGFIGYPQGTSLEVRDLFYNTPARKKFLKNVDTEKKKAIETAKLTLLPFNSIMFKIVDGTKDRIFYPKNVSKRERVGRFLADNMMDKMVEIGVEGSDIYGFISKPSADRSNSSLILTYINGRLIKNQMLTFSVIDSYRNLLMRGRYPIALIFLNMDPSEIDVNVHPTKKEVRFKNPEKFYKIVKSAIGDSLKKSVFIRDDFGGYRLQDPTKTASFFQGETNQSSNGLLYSRNKVEQLFSNIVVENHTFFSRMDILGVVCEGFIVTKNDCDMYIIDQHAAQERIIFEKLKADFGKKNIKSQMLLVPLEYEIGDLDSFATLEQILKSIGFTFFIQEGKVIVESVPALFSGLNLKDFFENIIQDNELIRQQETDYVCKQISRVACKLSVKLSSSLSTDELKRLLLDLDKCENPECCPHGRPTYSTIRKEDLIRMFKR